MKKKFCLSVFLFIIIFITFIYKYNYNKSVSFNVESDYKKEGLLSLNLETEVGSGKYEVTTSNVWPTEGYVFNSELSGCENGSNLLWDDSNKTIIMSGNVSDKCYVYFDIYVERRYDENCDSTFIACNVAKKFTGVQGENSIYYHDSSLVNGAGDNSYRFTGASDSVNNYVCFGSDETTCSVDNLYRIIGVFGGRVKLIKADYATSILLGTDGDYINKYSSGPYGTTNYLGSLIISDIGGYSWNRTGDNEYGSNAWSTSLLNKTNLNTNYLNNIGNKWSNMIDTTTWKVGGNTGDKISKVIPSVAYQNEIINPVTTNSTDNATEYSAKVVLMYVSDYGFAAEPNAWTTTLNYYYGSSIKGSNWMFMGLNEWTISRHTDSSFTVFYVDGNGGVSWYRASFVIAVRPVFFLNSFIKYVSGSGTQSDPIRVSN